MVVVLSRLKASRCLLQRHKLYASPARGYFSMKKSNQKSLGENPETPDAPVRLDRKVYDLPDLGLDDAYKVFILIRFLLGPNKMRRRHLESVSVRSTDDASASFVSSTASDRKGFVKGESVPLDRILVPFVRTKGTPPRRAVLTMPLQKAPRRRRRSQTGPRRIGEIKPSHSLYRQPLSQPCG